MPSCETNYALLCFQNLSPLTGLAHAAEEYHRSDVFNDIYLESLQRKEKHDVMEHITATLIQFFDNVIDGSLSLDVAFMKMVMVMDYTNYPKQSQDVDVGSSSNCYGDQSLSLIERGRNARTQNYICIGNQLVHRQSILHHVLKDNLVNNLKVLIHFMFVSVFGMSANEMIMDKNCANNKLYEYFIRQYLPKLRKDHIWFKHCGTKTHSIHKEIYRITNHEDIAVLITDYTYVYFEEYFEQISYFLDVLSKDNDHFKTALTTLRTRYVIGRTNTFPLLFGCMLSDKFIIYDTNQQPLLFSIHEMIFKYAQNSSIICEFFSHHSRYTFWNNAAHVIQWIENRFEDDVENTIRFMMSIIDKQNNAVSFLKMFEIPYFCLDVFDVIIDGHERAALVINYDTFIDALYVKGNIDVIFERLIDKYFSGYDRSTMIISSCLTRSLLRSIQFMIKYATLYPLKARECNIDELVDKAFDYLMTRFVTLKRFDWQHSNYSLNNMFRTGPIEDCVRLLIGFDTAKAALLKCKHDNIFNILRTKQRKYEGIDLLLRAVEEVDASSNGNDDQSVSLIERGRNARTQDHICMGNEVVHQQSERISLYEPQRKRRRIN